MRRRLPRAPQGPPLPHDRREGDRGPLQPQPPRRQRRRGQHRRRRGPPHPDPRRVLPSRMRPARHPAPAAGSVRRRHALLPRRRPRPQARHEPPRRARPRRGTAPPWLARCPHGQLDARRNLPCGRALRPPGLHRARHLGEDRRRFRAPPLRHPQALRARGRAPRHRRLRGLLLPQPLRPHGRLQGDAHGPPAARVLPRPARPPHGHRPGDVPLALQHQHLPQLEAGPPLSHHLAQRRDQHPARQQELDGRPRGPAGVFPLRRHPQGSAHHRRGGQRHRLPRQRP